MTIVNDRRHVTPESPVMTDPITSLRSTDPEKTFQTIVGAVKEYLKARTPTKKDANGKAWAGGFTIPSPDHQIVEEMARYVVESLLKSADPRAWTLVPVSDMRTGDVFTRYQIVDGRPLDEEATVLSTRPQTAGQARGKLVIKFRGPSGAYGEVAAASDYLFFVHRPTVADLRDELTGAL